MQAIPNKRIDTKIIAMEDNIAILSPSINMEKAYPAKIGDRKIKIIEKEMSNIVFILAMTSILF